MLGGCRSGLPVKVGLAFEFQVLARVPMGPEDVFMDVVVTESRVLKINGAKRAP
jgi:5-formyltetrahydrofolate cyclo-ligase